MGFWGVMAEPFCSGHIYTLHTYYDSRGSYSRLARVVPPVTAQALLGDQECT